MLTTKLLLPVVAVLLGLAFFGPLHLLFLADLPLVRLQGHWSIAGVRLDPTDLVLLLTLPLVVLRGRRVGPVRWYKVPYLIFWIALGVFFSLSYLKAPMNEQYLTGPVRIAYQLYRYCWKEILFYPLVILLLSDRKKLEIGLLMAIIGADLCSLQATIQGYTLDRQALGPFESPNRLGNELVIPAILCLGAMIQPYKGAKRLFFVGSFLLILRALLFSGSRGAIAAAFGGCCVLVVTLLTKRVSRKRVFRLLPVALVAAVLVLAAKPDLLYRPTIQKAMSAAEGTRATTMRWRMEQRWPYFWNEALQHPWFGVGTPVEQEFGDRANTPHNGFLAVAVSDGLPALGLYGLFILLTLKNGLVIYRKSKDPWLVIMVLTLVAALSGFVASNLVESTLRYTFARKLFWMICGLTAATARRRQAFEAPVTEAAAPTPSATSPLPDLSYGPRGVPQSQAGFPR